MATSHQQQPDTTPTPLTPDRVDVLMAAIRAAGHGDDLLAKSLVHRLRRASQLVDGAMRRKLAEYDIDIWEFEVMGALLLAPAHAQTMGQLGARSGLTSGAITNRITRLEQRGWLRRDIALADRRQIIVTLTDSGLERCKDVIAANNEAERMLFSTIDRDLVQRTTDALRELLLALEGAAPAE